MQKIRDYSDIHNEIRRKDKQEPFVIEPLDTDPETILVLAGDIDHMKHAVTYAVDHSDRFLAVILIPGNHEYYGGNLTKDLDKIDRDALPDNVHVVNNQTVVIGDTRILCTTLWSDLNKQDPFTVWSIGDTWSDYKAIRCGPNYRRLSTAATIFEHLASLRYLREELSKDWSGSTVVASHFSPSYQSDRRPYNPTSLTVHCFHSSLEYLMDGVDLWIHGHTHDNVDYMIDKTRVYANMPGYYMHPQEYTTGLIEVGNE